MTPIRVAAAFGNALLNSGFAYSSLHTLWANFSESRIVGPAALPRSTPAYYRFCGLGVTLSVESVCLAESGFRHFSANFGRMLLAVKRITCSRLAKGCPFAIGLAKGEPLFTAKAPVAQRVFGGFAAPITANGFSQKIALFPVGLSNTSTEQSYPLAPANPPSGKFVECCAVLA